MDSITLRSSDLLVRDRELQRLHEHVIHQNFYAIAALRPAIVWPRKIEGTLLVRRSCSKFCFVDLRVFWSGGTYVLSDSDALDRVPRIKCIADVECVYLRCIGSKTVGRLGILVERELGTERFPAFFAMRDQVKGRQNAYLQSIRFQFRQGIVCVAPANPTVLKGQEHRSQLNHRK